MYSGNTAKRPLQAFTDIRLALLRGCSILIGVSLIYIYVCVCTCVCIGSDDCEISLIFIYPFDL